MTHDKSLTDKDLENFKRSFREVGDLAEGNALWDIFYDFIPSSNRFVLLNGEINYTWNKETNDVCPLLQLLIIGNNIYLVFNYNGKFLVTSNKRNYETTSNFTQLFKKTFETIIEVFITYPSDKIELFTFDNFGEIMFTDMIRWIDTLKDQKQFSDCFDYEFTDHEAFQRIEALFKECWTNDKDFILKMFNKYNRDTANKMFTLKKDFFDSLKEIRSIIQKELKKNADFDSEKAYQKFLVERGFIN